MGSRAAERAKRNYSWQSVGAATLSIYEQVVGAGHARTAATA
jgi:glycosyltransferase involved in cell wall biosynthesis